MTTTSRPPFNLLSVVSNIERHKLASGEPWLLLFCLTWTPTDGSPVQYVRLVRDINPITFDANDGNGPQEYEPFNFMMGDLSVGSDGKVPDCEVQASNVMRALQGMIEEYAGAVGAQIDLYAVNTTNPAGEPDLTLSFTVVQTTSDAKLVHFKLGAASPLRRLFPIFLYRPNFCMWQYKGPQCGYTGTTLAGCTSTLGSPTLTVSSTAGLSVGMAITNGGFPAGTTIAAIGSGNVTASANAIIAGTFSVNFSMPSCSHTIDGSTGCQAHFPNSPYLRFGGFPGIDTNGAAVASVA